jgi:hypothetical protein
MKVNSGSGTLKGVEEVKHRIMEHKQESRGSAFRCPKCSKDMTKLLLEIPSWYFATVGPIVCDSCGHEQPHTSEMFAEARKIKRDDFNTRNPEFRDGASGFVPKKGKYRYKG